MSATVGSIATCCPITLAEGCDNAGGRWVSVRRPDGTIQLIDPIDGSVVPPANALAFCSGAASESHIQTVAAAATFNIPTANLESWSVRARGTGAAINVNGGGDQALDDNEVVEAASQDDDLLQDTVVVTGPARVLWTNRV